ncbi:rho GTPase-activating protein gacO-like, partial [Diaphorina citri]|uniref:Rho GTPase-activating protein gacO-like n=1 Tax=Diaphorina citri TaxID=121845 RepID=A0A1S4EQ88_DIACI
MSCVSSSSSSTLASSAATLAFRNQHKLVQKDGPPVQCINCNYKFKQPVPPPPTVSTPDLVSSGPENISSSVCEDETAPAPSSTPPESIEVNTANQTISIWVPTSKNLITATDPPPVPPIPILQATRRSSFTKKFTTLEQIKEEAKPTPVKSSTLTPKKKGRPRKKPAPEVVPPEEIEEPVSEKIKVKEINESVPEKKKVAKNKRKLELTDSKKKRMDQNEEDQQSKGERKAEGQKGGGGGNKGRRSVDGGERGVESSKAGKKEKKELISGPDHLQGGRLEENTPPNVMAANVYDPGKTVLAIWTDKIYYPAVIEEDLQSFLRVRYLDGFVKKIIKQQTVPMSVLYEDTPVHVMTEEDDELKPGKLK